MYMYRWQISGECWVDHEFVLTTVGEYGLREHWRHPQGASPGTTMHVPERFETIISRLSSGGFYAGL